MYIRGFVPNFIRKYFLNCLNLYLTSTDVYHLFTELDSRLFGPLSFAYGNRYNFYINVLVAREESIENAKIISSGR